MKKSIGLLTDVPTPYRVHFYNLLNKELLKYNFTLKVYFMSEKVKYRYWNIDRHDFQFDYYLDQGFKFIFNKSTFHFNPILLFKLLISKNELCILGGAWSQPTTLISILICKLNKTKSYFWLELNEKAIVHNNLIFNFIRNRVINSQENFILPGNVAVSLLKKIKKGNHKIAFLPNLIQEINFYYKYDKIEKKKYKEILNLDSFKKVIIWPARLNNKDKGIINFLSIIKNHTNIDICILIAGDGPDKKLISDYLLNNEIYFVKLLGFITEENLIQYYRAADLFLLPSIIDPNPLSVIEALWSSLPIMISSNCGNYQEALISRFNGWLIDFEDRNLIINSWIDFLNSDENQLEVLSKNSLSIAIDKFTSSKEINKFIHEII